MIYRIFLILGIVCSIISSKNYGRDGQQDFSKKTPIEVHVHVHNNNKLNGSMHSIIEHKDEYQQVSELRLSWWSTRKLRIALGALSFGYGAFLLRHMLILRYYLVHGRWGDWHEEVPLAVLYEIPHMVTVREILDAACAKRDNRAEVSQTCQLIHTILLEIEEEHALLSGLATYYRFLEWTRLSRIVPYNSYWYDGIKKKIDRLCYLKSMLERVPVILSSDNV